jgi:hypothetical protein
MELIGYEVPPLDVTAGRISGALDWTGATVRRTARRAVALVALIDRAGLALDDIAGINQNAGKIAEEISGLSSSAHGIDTNAEKLATAIDDLVAILPTLQRLTEIVDPLDNTVVRLGRFVDRLPGAGRRAQR